MIVHASFTDSPNLQLIAIVSQLMSVFYQKDRIYETSEEDSVFISVLTSVGILYKNEEFTLHTLGICLLLLNLCKFRLKAEQKSLQ